MAMVKFSDIDLSAREDKAALEIARQQIKELEDNLLQYKDFCKKFAESVEDLIRIADDEGCDTRDEKILLLQYENFILKNKGKIKE
jgi:hypothetical protein